MGKMTLMTGIAAGACATYFLDPEHGSVRRRRITDQLKRARDKLSNEEGHLAPGDVIAHTKEAVSDVRGRLRNGRREEILGGVRDTAQELASTGRWSPLTRFVAAGLGGAFVFYGLRRTSVTGLALLALGAGLVTRALTNFEMERPVRAEEDKAVQARAPIRRSRVDRSSGQERTEVPTAADLRDRAAEEEMTAFTENPDSIPSD